jgi:hypothetical protein
MSGPMCDQPSGEIGAGKRSLKKPFVQRTTVSLDIKLDYIAARDV